MFSFSDYDLFLFIYLIPRKGTETGSDKMYKMEVYRVYLFNSPKGDGNKNLLRQKHQKHPVYLFNSPKGDGNRSSCSVGVFQGPCLLNSPQETETLR